MCTHVRGSMWRCTSRLLPGHGHGHSRSRAAALAIIALIPACCIFIAFPHVLARVGEDMESEIDAAWDEDFRLAHGLDAAEPTMPSQCISIRSGYLLATAVAIVLQLCALVYWQGNVVREDGRLRADPAQALVPLPVLGLLALLEFSGRRR
jgi:hypothetical protein